VDIDGFITVFKELGVPAGFAVMILAVWWYSRKDSRQRDENNNTLHNGHLGIQVQQNKILSRLAGNIEDEQSLIHSQSEKINGKLDGIPSHVTQTAERVTAEITKKMDTQHGMVMDKVGGLFNPVNSIQAMLHEFKRNHETETALRDKQNALMQSIQLVLPNLKQDILVGIGSLVKEEKENELQKAIVNGNHSHSVDG
jgi:hypothetical protein